MHPRQSKGPTGAEPPAPLLEDAATLVLPPAPVSTGPVPVVALAPPAPVVALAPPAPVVDPVVDPVPPELESTGSGSLQPASVVNTVRDTRARRRCFMRERATTGAPRLNKGSRARDRKKLSRFPGPVAPVRASRSTRSFTSARA
jgi:hypothetical protein